MREYHGSYFYNNEYRRVTTYSWANDQPTIGLPATGNGDILHSKATNPGTALSGSNNGCYPALQQWSRMCDGPTKHFTITVNPTGEVDLPASQVVCNGENTTAVTFTTTSTGGVTTYTWTNSDISIGWQPQAMAISLHL